MAQVNQHFPRLQKLVDLRQMTQSGAVSEQAVGRVLQSRVLADQVSICNLKPQRYVLARLYLVVVDEEALCSLELRARAFPLELRVASKNVEQAMQRVLFQRFCFVGATRLVLNQLLFDD